MKKKYERPKTGTIRRHCSTAMLSSSYSVNDYNKGNDINVGDTDEPFSAKFHNYLD